MFTLKLIVLSILLPPTSLVLMAIAGYFLRTRYRRLGNVLLIGAPVAYLVLSLPAVTALLRATVERHQALSPDELTGMQAIVVLTGGIYPDAPEYGGRDTVSSTSLFRARYAAWLHARSGLPVAVVGGRPVPTRSTEAEVTAEVLRDEFRIPVRWVIGEGRDTLESGWAAARILRPEGIDRIVLVTNRWHMPRAELVFRDAGFYVRPAPTGFGVPGRFYLRDFLPSGGAINASGLIFKEWLGIMASAVLGALGGGKSP